MFLIKKKYTNHDKHENIFKMISKKTDTICFNLNEKSKQKGNSLKYFYDKNKDKDIEKFFIDTDLFYSEVDVYLYLVDKNIVPLSYTDNQKMISITNKLQPLVTFLSKNTNTNTNAKCILNDLFSFVGKFKKIHFVHGNLNLYNIFVDQNGIFKIIDFSNSSFKNNQMEMYSKDFYFLYIELYNFYNDNSLNGKEIIFYLKDLLVTYI